MEWNRMEGNSNTHLYNSTSQEARRNLHFKIYFDNARLDLTLCTSKQPLKKK